MINDDTPVFADAVEAEEAVRKTLEQLILKSGDGYAALSRLIGRNPAYIQQYLRRGVPRRLSEDDRQRLARHFGVSETQLGARAPATHTLAPDSAVHRSVEIGWLGCTEAGTPGLLLDAGLLQRVARGRHDWLAAHLVQGDSMAPTLLDGDHVLVDTADRQPLSDGLYAIESESRAVLKRLSINPATQLVAILSDNASYPSFPDCDPAQIRVIGRVVWLGRRLG